MKTPEPDHKWEALNEHYENILYLYRQYADKRPVMLLDIQEQRIYAYPYREFAADLSSRSQASLAARAHLSKNSNLRRRKKKVPR